MSERTNAPKWAEELKTATEQWYNADLGKRSVLTISVGEDEDGGLIVNASIAGDTKHLSAGATAVMNDDSEENPVGRILRMAAMKHLMSNAKHVGTIEVKVSDSNEEPQEETQNTESHE